jgi:hypothetical protein
MRPEYDFQCLRVHYDAGGNRVVVSAHQVDKFSDTHVRVIGVVDSNTFNMTRGGDMDVTSSNLVIDQGSCTISKF